MTDEPRDTADQPGGISDELRPYVDRAEAEAFDRLGRRLEQDRPVPSPAFRAELRAQMATMSEQQRPEWRPRNLRLAVAAYVASGAFLLVLGALGISGAGPIG